MEKTIGGRRQVKEFKTFVVPRKERMVMAPSFQDAYMKKQLQKEGRKLCQQLHG